MTATRNSRLFTGSLLALLIAATPRAVLAQECAKTPEDAWRLAREAVATKDAGTVMARLTLAYQTQNSIETAVGASMVIEMGGLSGEMSKSAGAAAKAQAAEKQLLAELDAILKKHKAPTIAEIGTPRLMKMQSPEVRAKFAPIDHASFARAMEGFFAKVEAAAKAAGVSGSGEPPKLDELVVGSGDLNAPLSGLTVTGETARAASGKVTMLFRRVNGCWLIDGRE
jgi:hypothetical protein